MLSSAALQKLERYAQIALVKCGVSATLAHAANDATAHLPIALSPFVSSSYDNFDLAAAVLQQNNNNTVNNNNNTTTATMNSEKEKADKGAMNRSVLLNTELWSQVARQLTEASVSANNAISGPTSTVASPTASVSDGLFIAIALAVQMVQWEMEHYLSTTVAGNTKPKLIAARAGHHVAVLSLIADTLTAISRDRAIESPSLTLAVATLTSTALNALLSNLLEETDRLRAAADAAASPSLSESAAADMTVLLLKIVALSSQQLRRASAAYPLPKLFTIRVAAQQLKQLGSGLINSLKDVNNVSVARMGAIGKMRLLQRLGLLFGVLRDYMIAAERVQQQQAISENSTAVSSAVEACKEAIIDVATPYVSTRTTRHHIYFRTEADEQRLAMSGCTDISTEVAAIDFVLTPPVDPDAVTTMKRMQQSIAAKSAIAITLQSWAGSTELIFIAFCRDGSWSAFAAEARRRILAEQAAKKSRANKKALKEEEKEIQRQMKQKAVEALLKAKEEEHKEVLKLQKAANAAANGITSSSSNGNTSDDDKDETRSTASSAHSSVHSSVHSGISAKSGNTATEMSKAESDVRSVMSAASFQSYSTFLSVVDSEAIANEQRMQHESIDGNTNLPVIFLEMACLALHQFLESVGGSGDNAYVMAPPQQEGDTPANNGATPATLKLSILPLTVVESVWSSISGMFAAFAAFIDAQPRTGLICFSLSEDVQYNKGLAYQSLGLLFARILVPALLKERTASGSAEDKAMATAIEALHVSQTLMIYERIASQAINQNLAAVLDMCCSAIQPLNAATAATTIASSSSSSAAALTASNNMATQTILQRLLVTIVSRLGQTNQLGLLLKAIIADHDAELKKKEAEAAALKKINGDDEDDEDEDDEDAAARKAAKAKAAAIDREMALRRTVLPYESSLRLLSTPSFREAFCLSVRRSLDPEGLLETLGDALAQVLLGMGGEDDEAADENDDANSDADGGEDPTVKSFRSLVHLKSPVLLGAASLVFQGLLPTSLVAFNIFEKCAEIEAYLLLFLEGSLYPTLTLKGGEDDETPSNAFTLQYLLQQAVPSYEGNMKVKPTHVKRLFLCVAETLLILRDTMYNVCLKDLGVDQLEKVVEVMNESLWQISELSSASAAEEVDEESAGQPRFLTYEKDSSLTLDTVVNHCVSADSTRSLITGASAMQILVRLAAQRLQLINSIGKLLCGNIKKENDDDEEENDAANDGAAAKPKSVVLVSLEADPTASPAFALASKALGVYVGQNLHVPLASSAPPHTLLTQEEWYTLVKVIGTKRWKKYLKAAVAELQSSEVSAVAAASSSLADASALLQKLPTELATILPAVSPNADASETDADDASQWSSARGRWRRLGCVPDWEEVIPSLANAVMREGARLATKKNKSSSASSASSVLQEVLRLSTSAQLAFTSGSTATAAVFSSFAEESFIEALVTISVTNASSSSSLLSQLIATATANAPNAATAPSVAFLATMYGVLASGVASASPTAIAALHSNVLSKAQYLLPSGAVANAHLATALKAFITLGKAVLKTIGSEEEKEESSASLLNQCACLLLSKHLPIYCDAADLSKLATKVLVRLNATEKAVSASNGNLLVVAHLVAASASTAAGDEDVKGLMDALTGLFTVTKGSSAAVAPASIVANNRALWASSASQLLRSVEKKSENGAASKKDKTDAKKGAADKKDTTTAAEVSPAERLANVILAAVEQSLLQSVWVISSSADAIEATITVDIAESLTTLEALSTMQRVRFTTFLPSIVALIAKVTSVVTSVASSAAALPNSIVVALSTVITRTLELARLPLPSLLNDASHQDATMALLFTLASPGIAKKALLPSSLSDVMSTLTMYATHRPIILAKRAALLSALFASLLNSIFSKLASAEENTNNTSVAHQGANANAPLSAMTTVASVNLLNAYNSTLAVVVRQCEFEASVASSTTPLAMGPSTSAKSFVCCAIATAIFGIVSSRQHLSLFARYSNELDYLAKDLVVEMLKGRLPATTQKRLVDVTVNRDLAAEKVEREKLKAKAATTTTTGADSDRVAGEKAVREEGDNNDEKEEDKEGNDETAEEAADAAMAIAASAAGKPVPLSVRKRFIIKRYRKEPTSIRRVAESSFADLCYAALGTSTSNDAQNLLKQEILRIRDEDGRAIFRPTN